MGKSYDTLPADEGTRVHGIEQRYLDMGLEVIHVTDQPNKAYPPHSHHATWLYSLAGSVKVRVGDQEWRDVSPDEEIVIAEGEEHEALTGPEGWEYFFAYPNDAEPFSFEA